MHVRLNFNRIRWLSGLQGNFHLPKPAEHLANGRLLKKRSPCPNAADALAASTSSATFFTARQGTNVKKASAVPPKRVPF